MWAVIVNTIAIIAGTTVGLLLRRGLPRLNYRRRHESARPVHNRHRHSRNHRRTKHLAPHRCNGYRRGDWRSGRYRRTRELLDRKLTSRFTGAGGGAKVANAFIIVPNHERGEP